MKINKGYIAVGLVIAFTLFFEIAAHADESDQLTFADRAGFEESGPIAKAWFGQRGGGF